MATTFKWVAGEGQTTALSTELNALGNGNTALSAAIDNLAGLYLYMDIAISLVSAAFVAASYISVYLICSLDGTNYEDGSAGTPGVIPARPPDAIIPLRLLTGAQAVVITGIPIPPLKFKLEFVNNAGVALGTTGNLLYYNRHNAQGV